MLEQKNLGTLTKFVKDGDKFKYAFFSIGECRRGLKSCCPVISLDGSLLKRKIWWTVALRNCYEFAIISTCIRGRRQRVSCFVDLVLVV